MKGASQSLNALYRIQIDRNFFPLIPWKFFVGTNDLFHQRVSDNIMLIEIEESNVLNVTQNIYGFLQARCFSGRQIDLCDVASHDRLRIKTESCL
jgi:hypothetical protein